MIYQFSPSELDYKTGCSRCFYLTKRKQISLGDFPPPVFSSFDSAQQNYFRKKKQLTFSNPPKNVTFSTTTTKNLENL